MSHPQSILWIQPHLQFCSFGLILEYLLFRYFMQLELHPAGEQNSMALTTISSLIIGTVYMTIAKIPLTTIRRHKCALIWIHLHTKWPRNTSFIWNADCRLPTGMFAVQTISTYAVRCGFRFAHSFAACAACGRLSASNSINVYVSNRSKRSAFVSV